MGTSPAFSTIFSKEGNIRDFLFAYLQNSLSKWGLLLKQRICSDEANVFLYEMTPIYKGSNNKNDSFASLEILPIHLKTDTVELQWLEH